MCLSNNFSGSGDSQSTYFRVGNGLSTLPVWAFANDTLNGIYLPTAGTFGFTKPISSGVNGGTGGSVTWNGATSGSGAITVDATGGVLRAPTLSMRQLVPLSNAASAQNTTGFMISGGICSGAACPGGNEASVEAICPVSGTFKNLFILSSAAASGQTLTATWRVNNTSTALTCTVTGTGITCNDTTHSATCTAGQSYALQVVTSATSGTINAIAGGIEFDNP